MKLHIFLVLEMLWSKQTPVLDRDSINRPVPVIAQVDRAINPGLLLDEFQLQADASGCYSRVSAVHEHLLVLVD
jgi:hypothetical protein